MTPRSMNADPDPLIPSRTPRTPVAVPARIHLLGAGGAGVSGAALLLHGQGHRVSASDLAASEHTQMLAAHGVSVTVGPAGHARLDDDVELLVRSAAVPESDPNVREARERGLPVLKYSE